MNPIRQLESTIYALRLEIRTTRAQLIHFQVELRVQLEVKMALAWKEHRFVDTAKDVFNRERDEWGQWVASSGLVSSLWYSAAQLDDPMTFAYSLRWGLTDEEERLYSRPIHQSIDS